MKPYIPFLFLFFTLLFLFPTMAEMKSIFIYFDTQPTISLGKFDFTHRGHIAIYVSSVTVLSSSPQLKSSRLGFFLANFVGYRLAEMDIKKKSIYIIDYCLYTTSSLSATSLILYCLPLTFISPSFSRNEYTLFFANCLRETSVFMFVRTELFNINSDGVKVYLSARQIQLPLLF